jgi:hypothetical protein
MRPGRPGACGLDLCENLLTHVVGVKWRNNSRTIVEIAFRAGGRYVRADRIGSRPLPACPPNLPIATGLLHCGDLEIEPTGRPRPFDTTFASATASSPFSTNLLECGRASRVLWRDGRAGKIHRRNSHDDAVTRIAAGKLQLQFARHLRVLDIGAGHLLVPADR